MLVTSPDVASLDGLLSWWESAEYVAEAFVILGCVGEFTAEFTDIRTPEWRHQLSKLSLLVLIAALAIELGALVRTNGLSGQEIALLNGVAADARTRAANAEGTAKGFDSKIAEAQRGTAEAQRDAEIAKKDASKADEGAAANEKEAARLGKATEDERLARVKIEARVAWRHLTDQQKMEISARLGNFSGQEGASFWYQTGDTEAAMFATDLAECLQEAHIVVQPPADMTVFHGSGRFGDPIKHIDTGVIVQSTKDERSRSLADVIVKELNLRGFDTVRQKDPPFDDRPTPQVWINVWPRPEGPQGEFKLKAKQEPQTKQAATLNEINKQRKWMARSLFSR